MLSIRLNFGDVELNSKLEMSPNGMNTPPDKLKTQIANVGRRQADGEHYVPFPPFFKWWEQKNVVGAGLENELDIFFIFISSCSMLLRLFRKCSAVI